MKRITLLLIFITGFSLAGFSQLVEGYQYREGLHKSRKQSFKAPIIRIGALSDTSLFTPVTIDPVIADTQAIFVVTIQVDSAFVVTELDTLTEPANVDTIQKIGDNIYNTGKDDNNVDYTDDNWEAIQAYLEASVSPVDSIDEEITAVPDTQVFYVLTKKVDSVLVVDEPTKLAQTGVIDSMAIDTFYQIGSVILQDDLESSIEEADWEIIKTELLRDSVDNNFDDLSYEEYLDVKLNNKQDTMADEPVNLFQPITVDQKLVETKVDTTLQTEVAPVTVNPGMSQQTDTVKTTKRVSDNKELDMINSRFSEMEKKLDAILSNQPRQTEEKQAVSAPEQTPPAPSKEIVELQKKIAQLEAQSQQKNDPELEKMKQQLLQYQLQSKAEQERNNEYVKMQAELESLRRSVEAAKVTTSTPREVTVQAEDTKEIKQLRNEVACMNQNMELMKQLLLQQQVIAALKSEPKQVVVAPKDTTSNSELIALKKEIAELKASMARPDTTAKQVVTPPVDKNKGEMDTLRQQIIALQLALKANREVKPPAPDTTKVIIEAPVVKSVNVRDMIKGREKQIVFFKIGSSKLPVESYAQINSIVQLILQYDQLYVVLEAYTDPSGDAARNLLLSKKRAESVKQALLQYGVPLNRIYLDYRGEDALSDPAFGRRVEMILKMD